MSDTELSPIKRALIEQRRLRARIQELESALAHPTAEPIAVIGLGCRFPGATGPGEFWYMLEHGVDGISEMPSTRWDVINRYDADPEAAGKIATRFGGYIDGIDQMDAQRFGITPREAATMDPQQRVLLEVTWEALEHAGLAPDTLVGSQMGVFVGIGPTDYLNRFIERGSVADIDAYLSTGNANSIASGRISYLLGVHGPSVAVDTACSSSLTAIQLACESLRTGTSDAAIAGGVGILLADQNYISLSKARMMAPDGRCKTFDSRADGFVRSEGCGVVVLKRLRGAQRDGDRVLAVIRGGAINQDGRSNGITAPNGPAQQALIRAAHENGRTSPASVTYVEAHGTGTALGDPIEVESLAATLGAGRDASQTLFLGSVKTNIGHTEAAAGVAGLIKTVLALRHREIPPNLHFLAPNPHIAWDAFPYFRIPTTPTPWEAVGGVRRAGVSAFGFSGTNVHLVVDEAPAVEDAARQFERPLHMVALSGKSDAALRVAAADLSRHLAVSGGEGDGASLANICYSVNTGRATLAYRATIAASNVGEMRARLDALVANSASTSVHTAQPSDGAAPRVLYVLSEHGLHDVGAARTLFETQPAFRAKIEACDVALRAAQLPGVIDAFSEANGPSNTSNTSIASNAVTRLAIEVALAAMWTQWGVAPDAVLYDGRGELAALVIAGVLRLDDALALASGTPASEAIARAAARVPMFSGAAGRRVPSSEILAATPWLDGGGLRTDATSGAGASSAALAAAAQEGYTALVDLSVLDWAQLSTRLGDVFAGGGIVDWRGFDRGYARARVDVPASPWIRERYWFDDDWSPDQPRGVDHGVWGAATRAAVRQADFVPADVELSRYAQAWTELDAFSVNAVAKAIGELGLFRVAGERHTLERAMEIGCVLPVYRHLLSMWLQRLTTAGLLSRDGDEFVAATAGGLRAPSAGTFGPASDAFPELQAYLRRCEHSMAAIVAGRQTSLDTLFPDGALETADFMYRHWGLARYYNGILEAVSEALIQRASDHPPRVLEIGAGTGGTASTLAPLFGAVGAEYWFTDVSEYFFGRAEEAFAGIPSVRFHRFDVDASPIEQGIPLGQFDLVVASNAVHAAKNLGRAIEHARSLLAPNGLLMLYEATTHLDWFEMSIALIEGWQHHIDDLRAETPLLSPTEWERALTDRGFDRVASYPPSSSPAGILAHHVILASVPASAVIERTAVPATAQANGQADVRTLATTVATVAAAAPDSPSIRDSLAALTLGERIDSLRDLVQRQVKRVMRLRADTPPPGANDRLMSAGMDSLMAVDLRKLLTKELGGAVRLPSTLIFDHPTIGAIVALILDSLDLGDKPAPAAPIAAAPATPPSTTHTTAASLAELSDAEVEAMLLNKLNGMLK